MSEASVPVPAGESSGTRHGLGPTGAQPDSRRWLILVVIAVAQLMVVLDATVMNIALPSAQRDLGFSNVDRQWIVTAYSLSFGSLLLFSGRLADLIGRKVMFITGLAGFAVASAVGGASVNFEMLVTARACQGVFGAMLAPAALSLLATTFTDPKERGKAFGIYGSVAAGGGAVGLLLGGALTSYLNWRWCLYINLVFAGAAIIGGLLLLHRQPKAAGARLDVPGVLLVSAGMFCLVYGFSNAATHDWSTPSTYGFLAVGVVLLAAFAYWMSRAKYPLLPPRVVLDRNRGAAYLGILIVGAGMFGIFLFLTYYLQDTLRYSPVITGVAFLPMIAGVATSSNVSNIVLMPRIGPKPIVTAGLVLAAAGMAWLTRIGPHSAYATTILGPIIVTGLGMGLMFSTAFNTGTYGVRPQDTGVASASVNTGQQLGGAMGTALLNTIAASATVGYL
ncbi:MAG TPA: MFS transporter, partial [Trebonia sp.]|nr:MFS transporter [Trebonia sp.]